MFLVGGPAFSGTTLLAHLLNQNETLCLDEPAFEDPEQSHGGIPFLQRLFPQKQFPARPTVALSYPQALALIEQCQTILDPLDLGIKTCNWAFLEFAQVYRARGYPVIAIVRDIRDALARPLPPWLDEEGLNARYRAVWGALPSFDMWFRYEDLIRDPEMVFAKLSRVLGKNLVARRTWSSASVHPPMFKLDRHELLRGGALVTNRVGLWKNLGYTVSPLSIETSKLMGYR